MVRTRPLPSKVCFHIRSMWRRRCFFRIGGDVFGRLEGSYDLRLTQRVILEPRIELELAAPGTYQKSTSDPEFRPGELGLRLRYDIRREFAPYIGVNFEKTFGQTEDFLRAAGEDGEETNFIVGLRVWF